MCHVGAVPLCPLIVGAVPLCPPSLRKDYYVESHD